jgi:MoaA/NifB/PqqE/SkfB family radical SAM enzyme
MQDKGTVNLFWIGRGEATLYKYLGDLVNYFTQKYRGRVTHYIQTNGIDIRQIRRIVHLANVIVSISWDGFTNDLNRGMGTAAIIERNIRALDEIGFQVNVHGIVSPENMDTMEDFIKYVKAISSSISVTLAPLYAPEREAELAPMRDELARRPELAKRLGMDTETKKDDKIYLCLSCEGFVYNCCELVQKVGESSEFIPDLVRRFSEVDACPSCKSYSYCAGKYSPLIS